MVLHACAGKEVATRSHQGVFAAPNGVLPQFCSLSAATVVLPPQDTPLRCNLNLLNMNSTSACKVFDRIILACRDFSLSWFLVEWSLIAARGCLNFGGIFGEV